MARGNNKGKKNRYFSKKYSTQHKKSLSSRNSNIRVGQKKYKKKYSDSKYNLDDSTKRQKIESLADKISSSESEQEEDVVKQLLGTFNVNLNRKNTVAIESEDSDTSEDQNDSLDISRDYSDDDSLSNDGNINTKENKSKAKNEEIENYTEEYQESEEENEIDQETLNEENEIGNHKDPFVKHLCYELHENLLESLQNTNTRETVNIEWPELGKLTFTVPKCECNETIKSNFTIAEEKKYAPLGKFPQKIDKHTIGSTEISIKTQIQNNIRAANKGIKSEETEILSSFQCELFSIINNYQDLYYSNRTFENCEEIRFVYALHSINHVLKTRTKILHHNARLQKKDQVPEEYRDQGLVRPKVLILVPFRDSALKIVNILIDILVPNDKGQVINKNRFLEDYTGGELIFPKRNPKPEDYEHIFAGNSDDTFKIGIKVTKKSLKLYSDFYSSDIIIASPLGLRLTIGAEGEKDRDYDFLASIELLILDQTEIFLMQNWDHLIHTLNHIHMQPKQTHGTDFSRVRSWVLNGWSKYYRQTLIFSSVLLPEINSIFNKKCHNFAGAVKTVNSVSTGAIVNVCVQVPQVYRKFEVANVLNAINKRFELFVEKILPQYRDNIMKQCLIYIPNYFDYVRVRNYFKREDIGFVQICEYSKDAKVARARDMFFHGDAHFLLYSERFHFFRRIRIKGIRHIIFYQPPTFPHFYSELCNFMQEANQNRKCGSMSNMTVTVIYSKYDLQQVAAIVGTDRLMKMTSSTKNFHMFTNLDT